LLKTKSLTSVSQILELVDKISNDNELKLVSCILYEDTYYFEVYSDKSQTIHSGRVGLNGFFNCDCFGFIMHRTICRHLKLALSHIRKSMGDAKFKSIIKNYFIGDV